MEEIEPKQVIVVRKDLNMRKGKIASQVAHASSKVFFDRAMTSNLYMSIECTEEMMAWVKSGVFTTIVVSVDSEEELHDLKKQADIWGIPNALIQDMGKTEFHGVPTYTCLAIGPDDSKYVDEITGDLPLM